jgi:hypothetical protein
MLSLDIGGTVPKVVDTIGRPLEYHLDHALNQLR